MQRSNADGSRHDNSGSGLKLFSQEPHSTTLPADSSLAAAQKLIYCPFPQNMLEYEDNLIWTLLSDSVNQIRYLSI